MAIWFLLKEVIVFLIICCSTSFCEEDLLENVTLKKDSPAELNEFLTSVLHEKDEFRKLRDAAKRLERDSVFHPRRSLDYQQNFPYNIDDEIPLELVQENRNHKRNAYDYNNDDDLRNYALSLENSKISRNVNWPINDIYPYWNNNEQEETLKSDDKSNFHENKKRNSWYEYPRTIRRIRRGLDLNDYNSDNDFGLSTIRVVPRSRSGVLVVPGNKYDRRRGILAKQHKSSVHSETSTEPNLGESIVTTKRTQPADSLQDHDILGLKFDDPSGQERLQKAQNNLKGNEDASSEIIDGTFREGDQLDKRIIKFLKKDTHISEKSTTNRPRRSMNLNIIDKNNLIESIRRDYSNKALLLTLKNSKSSNANRERTQKEAPKDNYDVIHIIRTPEEHGDYFGDAPNAALSTTSDSPQSENKNSNKILTQEKKITLQDVDEPTSAIEQHRLSTIPYIIEPTHTPLDASTSVMDVTVSVDTLEDNEGQFKPKESKDIIHGGDKITFDIEKRNPNQTPYAANENNQNEIQENGFDYYNQEQGNALQIRKLLTYNDKDLDDPQATDELDDEESKYGTLDYENGRGGETNENKIRVKRSLPDIFGMSNEEDYKEDLLDDYNTPYRRKRSEDDYQEEDNTKAGEKLAYKRKKVQESKIDTKSNDRKTEAREEEYTINEGFKNRDRVKEACDAQTEGVKVEKIRLKHEDIREDDSSNTITNSDDIAVMEMPMEGGDAMKEEAIRCSKCKENDCKHCKGKKHDKRNNNCDCSNCLECKEERRSKDNVNQNMAEENQISETNDEDNPHEINESSTDINSKIVETYTKTVIISHQAKNDENQSLTYKNDKGSKQKISNIFSKKREEELQPVPHTNLNTEKNFEREESDFETPFNYKILQNSRNFHRANDASGQVGNPFSVNTNKMREDSEADKYPYKLPDSENSEWQEYTFKYPINKEKSVPKTQFDTNNHQFFGKQQPSVENDAETRRNQLTLSGSRNAGERKNSLQNPDGILKTVHTIDETDHPLENQDKDKFSTKLQNSGGTYILPYYYYQNALDSEKIKKIDSIERQSGKNTARTDHINENNRRNDIFEDANIIHRPKNKHPITKNFTHKHKHILSKQKENTDDRNEILLAKEAPVGTITVASALKPKMPERQGYLRKSKNYNNHYSNAKDHWPWNGISNEGEIKRTARNFGSYVEPPLRVDKSEHIEQQMDREIYPDVGKREVEQENEERIKQSPPIRFHEKKHKMKDGHPNVNLDSVETFGDTLEKTTRHNEVLKRAAYGQEEGNFYYVPTERVEDVEDLLPYNERVNDGPVVRFSKQKHEFYWRKRPERYSNEDLDEQSFIQKRSYEIPLIHHQRKPHRKHNTAVSDIEEENNRKERYSDEYSTNLEKLKEKLLAQNPEYNQELFSSYPYAIRRPSRAKSDVQSHNQKQMKQWVGTGSKKGDDSIMGKNTKGLNPAFGLKSTNENYMKDTETGKIIKDVGQMRDALNGHLASLLVDTIIKRVSQEPPLHERFSGGLSRRHDYKNQVKDLETFRNSETQEDIKHTEEMLRQIMDVLNKIVLDQVRRRTCKRLSPELQQYLSNLTRPNRNKLDEEDKISDEGYPLPLVKGPKAKSRSSNPSQDDFLFSNPEQKSELEIDEMEIRRKIHMINGLLEKYKRMSGHSQFQAEEVQKYLKRHLKMSKKMLRAIEEERKRSKQSTQKINPYKQQQKREYSDASSVRGLKFNEMQNSEAKNIYDGDYSEENGWEKDEHKRDIGEEAQVEVSEKYRKLVEAAERFRRKRETEERLGQLFGHVSKRSARNEQYDTIRSKNKDPYDVFHAGFEKPRILSI